MDPETTPFKLEVNIVLGPTMHRPDDLGDALEQAARDARAGATGGRLKDRDGRIVGAWILA